MQVLNDSQQNEKDKKYYNNFVYSYKTEVTRKNSLLILKYYMKFLGVTTLRELVENKSQQIIEADIKAYLVYLRTKRKISYSAAALYLSVIKKFYVVNTDYQFKWKLINMYLGNDDTDDDNNIDDPDLEDQQEEGQDDRPYSREEIQQMFNAAQDIRVKLVISLMSSTGIRNSVVNNLKLRDLEKIEKYNIYKITAYRKSKKFRYNTFTTPEAAAIIDSYLDYRKSHGEQLKGNSPLIREQFSTNDKLKINNPRHLSSRAIRTMINDILIKYTNLRKKLKFDYENKRKEGRNPTKLTHAFRKFFHTESAKAGVYPDYIELLLGHKLPGVRSHYMIPDINTLLEGTKETKGYVAAIDSLTINDENRLQKQVQELKDKDDYQKYIIDKKINDLTTRISQYEEIEKEGRIMSKQHAQKFADLYEKFQALISAQDKERKLDRETELETDPDIKDQKFDKMLSATRETIKKRSELERTVKDQLQK
jgi:integrase